MLTIKILKKSCYYTHAEAVLHRAEEQWAAERVFAALCLLCGPGKLFKLSVLICKNEDYNCTKLIDCL